MLNDADIERLADKLSEKMTYEIDPDRHYAEHEYIKKVIEKEQSLSASRRKVYEKILGSVGAVGILAVLGSMGKLFMDVLTTVATK